LLSYGHLNFFTLGPDAGHQTSDTQVCIVYILSNAAMQSVHWTDNNGYFSEHRVFVFHIS